MKMIENKNIKKLNTLLPLECSTLSIFPTQLPNVSNATAITPINSKPDIVDVMVLELRIKLKPENKSVVRP